MTPRNDFIDAPRRKHARDGGAFDVRQVELVGVSSGVAAGRKLRVKANARAEWWTMLTTLDQFDACISAGALRFEDPILFAQVRREFEHVFKSPNRHALDPGLCPGVGLRSASP